MKHIMYVGTADTRILVADDLKQMGVDGFKKTLFHPHVPVAVDDEVAAVLVASPLVMGEFVPVNDEDPVQPEPTEPVTATAVEGELASRSTRRR